MDDDGAVRRLVAAALHMEGHRVLEADCGAAALALLAGGNGIDLVITDLVMPGLNGRQLAAVLRERGCAAPVLFMTGFAGQEDWLPKGAAVVKKPFAVPGLLDAVRQMLASD